jgi:hypothetical protein
MMIEDRALPDQWEKIDDKDTTSVVSALSRKVKKPPTILQKSLVRNRDMKIDLRPNQRPEKPGTSARQ